MQRVGNAVKSVKAKTLHVGQFNCLTYDVVSLDKLRQKIAISPNFKTRVKLSKDGWTDSGSGFFSRHKLRRTSVPLNDIECLIRDELSTNILFCVFNLRPGNEFRYSVVAYKFSDVAAISKFGELFTELRGEVFEEVTDPFDGGVVMRRHTVNGEISIINISRPNSIASPLMRPSSSSGIYNTIGAESNPDDVDNEEDGSIDHVFDDVIDGNLEELSKKIYPSPGLLTILRDKHVLTVEQINDVRAQKTDAEKSVRLMELLKMRPNSCFGNFIQALEKTEQGHIAKFLRRGSTTRRATSAIIIAEHQGPNTASLDRRSTRQSAQRSVDLLQSTPRLASNSSLSHAAAISQMSLVNQNSTAVKSCMRSNTGTGSEFGSRRSIAWSANYESLGTCS